MFTIIIVHYNTPLLLKRALQSIDEKISILIVDNSEDTVGGVTTAINYAPKNSAVIQPRTQMFHGDGLHFGIQHINTPYFVTMDSDVYIKDSEIFSIMLKKFEKNVYGTGYVTPVDKEGIDSWNQASKPPYIQYLHPFFSMIHTEKYFQCKPFVHHGAPAIRAMQSLPKKYKLEQLGLMEEYVHHDGRGTRKITNEWTKGWK